MPEITPKTPKEMIEEIDIAIYKLTTGLASSYSIGSRSYTYLNINDLINLKKYYELKLHNNGASMYTNYGSFRR